jgi:FixJ family two-component response regulator
MRQRSLDTAVIVLTAHGSLETAVDALRRGAHDYLLKPCDTADLRESVRTALLKRQREQRQQDLLRQVEQSLNASLEEIRAAVVQQQPVRVGLTDAGSELAGLPVGRLAIAFAAHRRSMGPLTQPDN